MEQVNNLRPFISSETAAALITEIAMRDNITAEEALIKLQRQVSILYTPEKKKQKFTAAAVRARK